MIVTIEISLYPLAPDYKEVIKSFIRSLKAMEQPVEIHTTEMSTLVKGEWAVVMSLLEEQLGHLFNQRKDLSTVIKIIPQDLPIDQGYRTDL